MVSKVFEKAMRLNETILEQFVRASEIQMNAFKRYSEMAMDQVRQVKKVSEVRDAKSFKDLTSEQTATLRHLNEQFAADLKSWRDYSSEARDQIQKAISSAANPTSRKSRTSLQMS